MELLRTLSGQFTYHQYQLPQRVLPDVTLKGTPTQMVREWQWVIRAFTVSVLVGKANVSARTARLHPRAVNYYCPVWVLHNALHHLCTIAVSLSKSTLFKL